MNATTLVLRRTQTSYVPLGAGAVLVLSAWLLAGFVPVAFSIAIVFLFAGPHNWIEARYFLGRLPARWGKLKGFFLLGFAGVFGLTAASIALPYVAKWNDWSTATETVAHSLWNSALLAWIAGLVWLRSGQNPRRDWSWTMPAFLTLIAVSWLQPRAWSLGLVYLHPLVALWILDREVGRSRPEWLLAYRRALLALPVLLGLLWWRLADAPPLSESNSLEERITLHAGAAILPQISSHLLVSTHTFLEMLHYSVWLLAIPLVGLSAPPWRLQTIALARRSVSWRRVVWTTLAIAGLLVAVLWACFLVDYGTTRDIYFTIALLHVLAEVPFLLRAL